MGSSGWARRRRLIRIGLIVIVLLIGVLISSLAQDKPLAGREGPVWIVPITGTVDLGLASFVQRSVHEAIDEGAAAIVVEINTFGGRVDAATEIRDTLIGSGIPTVAYVKQRAWSAGALIAIATDWIWMAPGSSMGAAEPRPADPKTISALRAEFESMAQRRHRPQGVAAAMVDADVVIEGLTGPGEILTLTPEEAVEFGFAEGIASYRRDVLRALGLESNRENESLINWGEKLARFLTDPVVSQLLLTLGFLGLLAEISAPGWGVPGSVGLICLALFFGSRMFVGLVGWEAIGLFVIGFILLLLEVFVSPGLGILGIGGLAGIFAGLYLSFGDGQTALRSIGLTIILTGIGTYILWKSGRRLGVWDRLILSSRQTDEDGFVAPQDLRHVEGRQGTALTSLRPAGVVLVGDERIDAVSEGGYIHVNSPIIVVRVEGTRVVVRESNSEKS